MGNVNNHTPLVTNGTFIRIPSRIATSCNNAWFDNIIILRSVEFTDNKHSYVQNNNALKCASLLSYFRSLRTRSTSSTHIPSQTSTHTSSCDSLVSESLVIFVGSTSGSCSCCLGLWRPSSRDTIFHARLAWRCRIIIQCDSISNSRY